MLGLLSSTQATVLIRGESGTGKELAARTLHSFAVGSTTRSPCGTGGRLKRFGSRRSESESPVNGKSRSSPHRKSFTTI